MSRGTRERIVEAGATLMWRHGYPATGMKQIADAAKAPFGSVYHFFPGGKEALGAEAIRWSGELYGRLVGAIFDAALAQPGADMASALRVVFAQAAGAVESTGYADACPIATVALEMSSGSEPIRRACDDTFEAWLAELDRRFHAAGVPADRLRPLSQTFLMLLEGGFLLCRVARTTAALHAAGDAIVLAFQAATA